jgi:phytoene dehydrogenase-like protein
MLYLVARAPQGSRDDAHHLQLIAEAQQPLSEGNHVFVSASSALEIERAPPGRRTLTVSTHLPLAELRAAGAGAGTYVQSIQQRMKRTLQARAPEWFAGIEHEMSASPRTFARFVGRPSGTVGGLPRRVGISSYAGIGPSQVLDGIWLVGDSVFPGQSALATAIGGVRTASAVRHSLGG